MRPDECPLSSTALQHMLKKTPWKINQAIKSDLFSFKSNKLHPPFSCSELLHSPCTRTEGAALQRGDIEPQNEANSRAKGAAHTCIPSRACQNAQTGWPDSSPPPQLFTPFSPNGSAELNAGTPDFQYCEPGVKSLKSAC